MTVEAFITMLSTLSVISGLITEAIKKFVGESKEFSTNIIVLVVSCFVGVFGVLIYYNSIGSPINILYALLMAVANWLVAMLGYDKIVQTIAQIKSKGVK